MKYIIFLILFLVYDLSFASQTWNTLWPLGKNAFVFECYDYKISSRVIKLLRFYQGKSNIYKSISTYYKYEKQNGSYLENNLSLQGSYGKYFSAEKIYQKNNGNSVEILRKELVFFGSDGIKKYSFDVPEKTYNSQYSGDGRLYAAVLGGNMKIFKRTGGEYLKVYEVNSGFAGKILFSDDAKYFAFVYSYKDKKSGYTKYAISINSSENGKSLKVFYFKEMPNCMIFSPDGKYFAADAGEYVQIIKTEGMKEIKRIPKAGAGISNLAFSLKNDYFAADYGGNIKVYDFKTFEIKTEAYLGQSSSGMVFFRDSSAVLYIRDDCAFKKLDLF